MRDEGRGGVRPWLQAHAGIQRRPDRRVPGPKGRLSGGRADVAMVCARSTFERTPAGIRDHHAGKLDLPPPHLMVCRCALATPSWTRWANISMLNPRRATSPL